MKNATELAKALRKRGYKFSQQTLLNDLADITPAMAHGRMVVYEDAALDQLEALFAARLPAKPVASVPEFVPFSPEYTFLAETLISIEKMLKQLVAKDEVNIFTPPSLFVKQVKQAD